MNVRGDEQLSRQQQTGCYGRYSSPAVAGMSDGS